MERFGARRGLTGEALEPIFPTIATRWKPVRSARSMRRRSPRRWRRFRHRTVPSTPPRSRRPCLSIARVRPAHGAAAGSANPRPSGSGRAEPGGAAAAADPPQALAVPPPGFDRPDRRTAHPACQAIWDTILTPLAARRPDDALGPDDRSPSQRLHDAFEEAGRRLLGSRGPPRPRRPARPADRNRVVRPTWNAEPAGPPPTTAAPSASTRRCDWAPTAGCCPLLDDAGGILGYGRGRRLASPGQRRALFARDRGCTFPGCNRSAARSESITPPTGRTAAGPTWTAWPSPAASITTRRRKWAGAPS